MLTRYTDDGAYQSDEFKRTPWGIADCREDIAEGVVFYGTRSHGGLELTPSLLELIPPVVKDSLINPGWAEEDCEMSLILSIIGVADERHKVWAKEVATRFERYEDALPYVMDAPEFEYNGNGGL